jgi:hypothetical protein
VGKSKLNPEAKENIATVAAFMVIAAAAPVAGAAPPSPKKTKTVTLAAASPLTATRRHLFLVAAASALPTAVASAAAGRFTEIPSSGGVKALELREGSGEVPADGDQVKAIVELRLLPASFLACPHYPTLHLENQKLL